MRISSKLVLFALSCSVLPLIAAFWLSFDAARASLDRTVRESLISSAGEELGRLQQRLVAAKHGLSQLGRQSVMQEVIFGGRQGMLEEDLVTFAATSPNVAEILVANTDGLVVAGTDPAALGSDLRTTWEFESARLGIEFDGPVADSYRLDQPVATQSIPIYSNLFGADTRQLIGVLIGSISWQSLKSDLYAHKLLGGTQGRGRRIVLQSTVDDRVLYATPGVSVPPSLLEPTTGPTAFRELAAEGQMLLAASVDSVATDSFRDPGWRLHVLLDTDIAYASVNELRDWFVLVGVCVLVLVSALSYLLARSITRPVESLVEAAHALSQGEDDHPLATDGRDEIGKLSQCFDAMRQAVRANERELIHKTEQSDAAARLKGEFLANMSHEVRTPINGVLGMTELLLATELDSTQGRYAETIFRSGQSLLSVINDILDFSKIEAGKLEVQDVGFDLRELVEDVVEMVAESAHRKGLELALDMAPDSHVAYRGDSNRIRQILLNLLSNAIKFTEEGEVRLAVRVDTMPRAGDASSVGTRAEVSLTVIDTGIGIPESSLANVFESFVQADGSTTRRFGGTGLGLAISSRLARLMGGDIDVASVVGTGSRFRLHVPLDALPASVSDAWHQPGALRGRHVLIVDDNEHNREILETQMRFWGAEPVMANDAAQALATVRETERDGRRFELLVLDMHMPGMNGLELADALIEGEGFEKIPFVLLSSVCDQLDPARCRAAGIDSVITKPVRQPELYRALSALLGGERHEAPMKRRVLATERLAGRVLIAEDNPTNQFMMSEMLRQIGLDAVVAEHGQAAIDALEGGGYAADGFDVVLMDCQMPVLDGFAATREIRRRELGDAARRRMPIVALTANALEGDRAACLEAGMDEYLSKPVSAKRLVEQLSAWLQPADGAASPAEPRTAAVDAAAELVPVLDRAVYDELVAMAENAYAGFLAELLSTYRQSAEEDLRGIRDGLAAGDAARVGSSAHRLKSSSANWGGRRLASSCSAVETAAREGDLEVAATSAAALPAELAELLAAIEPPPARAAA